MLRKTVRLEYETFNLKIILFRDRIKIIKKIRQFFDKKRAVKDIYQIYQVFHDNE
jgi:hypothetical protein